jgi:pyruvate formate lyase activating enzyme
VLLKGEDRINKKFCINCLKCTEICPSAALITTGRKVSVDEVIAEVMKDAPFYANSGGGITVSGGEPLAQADFTAALLKTARGQGLNTCIDTSGYAVKSAWDKVLPHLNIALYDIKIMDDEMHKKIIGVSNRIIIENLKRVAAEVEVRIRIPLIPGINDTEDFFEQLGNLAAGAGVKKCDIIPYHSYGNHKYQLLGKAEEIFHCGSVAAEKTEKFKQMLDDRGFEVTIGG